MKLYCKNCDLEVTPYVTPEGANWKADCPVCDGFIATLKDEQPNDDFLAYALARRKPRTDREREWLKKRQNG